MVDVWGWVRLQKPYQSRLLVFCVFFLFTLPVSFVCAEPETDTVPSYWSVQIENDGWGNGDDKYYTSGIEFSYMRIEEPPRWLRVLADFMPFYERTTESGVVYSLGQSIFTPDNIGRKELIYDDRPYAGWLYGGASIISRVGVNDNFEFGNSLNVTVGIVGPGSHADNVQDQFHRFLGTDRPEGWDNQLEDELGFVLTYTRAWRYFSPGDNSIGYELSPHCVAALGNVYTYGGGGVTARWGTKLRDDVGPPTISPGFPGASYFKARPDPNWYFFAGVEGRVVARNIFLDGNTFEDSHSVDKKILVGDFQCGFAFHIKNIRIALSNIVRTKEFDEQQRITDYGAINIAFYL